MDKIRLESPIKLIFIDYLNFLEATKTCGKAMHWATKKIAEVKNVKGAHKCLDELIKTIDHYEDKIAEISQGVLGTYIRVEDIVGKKIDSPSTPKGLCEFLLDNIYKFYKKIPEHMPYIGIRSETEAFIAEIQKFIYLFDLTI